MSSWNTTSRNLGLALLLALAVAGSARAQDGFLKLGDIGGGVQGEGHKDWIELIHVDLDPQGNTLTAEATLRVSKRLDKASPLIQQALAKNERFPEATLRVPKGGGSEEYLEIRLENVIISSYQTGGTQDRPTESISLNFTKITYNYPEKKLAGPAGPVKAGYDLEKVEEGAAGPGEGPPAAGLRAAVADLLPLNGLTLATSFIPWGQTATILTDAASHKEGGRCFFRYRYETGNQGQAAAGATTNRIRLDADNGPSLADDAMPALAAGDHHTASGLLPLVVGTWTLYVNVDDDLVVVEGDEQNNLRRVRVRVEGSCEDEAETGRAQSPRSVSLGSGSLATNAVKPQAVERISPSMQNDALSAARFSITVDGYEIASFSELAGNNTSVEPVTFVLKRGKATGPALWAWHEAVREGNMAAARKSASLVMYDYDGTPVARYHLQNAWPSKVEIGGLTAQGNVSDFEFLKARASRGGEVAMEAVTIVCENIQRVSR